MNPFEGYRYMTINFNKFLKKKSRSIILYLIIVIFLIIIVTGIISLFTKIELVVETDIPNITDASIYYFKNLSINETSAWEIASGFGFSNDSMFKSYTSKYFWEEGKSTLEIWKRSGCIMFYVWSAGREKGILPTEDEALEYAKNYILKYRGLLDDLNLKGVITEYVWTTPDDKYPVDIMVRFEQTIERYETAGLNRIYLQIGPEGVLWDYSQQGLTPYIREINHSVNIEILSAQEVLEGLEDNITDQGTETGAYNWHVINMELVYFFKDHNDIQNSLNPTWEITLKGMNKFPWNMFPSNHTRNIYVDAFNGEIVNFL